MDTEKKKKKVSVPAYFFSRPKWLNTAQTTRMCISHGRWKIAFTLTPTHQHLPGMLGIPDSLRRLRELWMHLPDESWYEYIHIIVHLMTLTMVSGCSCQDSKQQGATVRHHGKLKAAEGHSTHDVRGEELVTCSPHRPMTHLVSITSSEQIP